MKKFSRYPDLLDEAGYLQMQALLQESRIVVLSCLFWWMNERQLIPSRTLSDSHIFVLTKGEISFRIGEADHTVRAGQVVFIPEGIPHQAETAKGCCELEVFGIHLHGLTNQARPLLSLFEDPVGEIHPLESWVERLRLLTHLMHRDDAVGQAYGESLIRGLLIDQVIQGKKLTKSPRPGDARIWNAEQTIHTHYASPLSVAELARQASLSEAQFRKLFLRYLGITPKAYIQRVRLTRCRMLLQTNPHLPIKAIADATGIGDAFYLHQLFRKTYGMTPGEYRSKLHSVTEKD